MSWNGYPKYVINSLIKRLSAKKGENNITTTDVDDNIPKIWLTLPYAGPKGDSLIRSCIRKIRKHLKSVKLIVKYRDKKLSFFCSTKDKIPVEQNANVIYEITCPGCGGKYIGKTDRCMAIRMDEHGGKPDQPMHRHLSTCKPFYDYVSMFALPAVNQSTPTKIMMNQHFIHAVKYNYKIIDCNLYNFKWHDLELLEAYYIRTRHPVLNHGLKASKEFKLFI